MKKATIENHHKIEGKFSRKRCPYPVLKNHGSGSGCPERLDPDPICPERLDPDPDPVNIRPDPQPCLEP